MFEKRHPRPDDTAPPEYVAPKGIEAIPQDWLFDVEGTTDKVAMVGTELGLKRDDGTDNQEGDVLSMQPDGTMQTRPGGSQGNFERAAISGPWLVYRPVGSRCFLVPLATVYPNQ